MEKHGFFGEYDLSNAGIEDIPEILRCKGEFIRELSGKDPSDELVQATRVYLKEHLGDGTVIYRLAWKDRKVVSLLSICFYQVAPKAHNFTGRIGYVFNVYTDKEHRGRGLAGKLLDDILESAREWDCGEVYLYAEKKSDAPV